MRDDKCTYYYDTIVSETKQKTGTITPQIYHLKFMFRREFVMIREGWWRLRLAIWSYSKSTGCVELVCECEIKSSHIFYGVWNETDGQIWVHQYSACMPGPSYESEYDFNRLQMFSLLLSLFKRLESWYVFSSSSSYHSEHHRHRKHGQSIVKAVS